MIGFYLALAVLLGTVYWWGWAVFVLASGLVAMLGWVLVGVTGAGVTAWSRALYRDEHRGRERHRS